MPSAKNVAKFVSAVGTAAAVLSLGAIVIYGWFEICLFNNPNDPQVCIEALPDWLFFWNR